jgi:hypothetical protein
MEPLAERQAQGPVPLAHRSPTPQPATNARFVTLHLPQHTPLLHERFKQVSRAFEAPRRCPCSYPHVALGNCML